jgi:hypothetical protein
MNRKQPEMGTLTERVQMTIEELKEKRTTEAAKLERMNAAAHKANLTSEAAERELERLESELAKEQEESVLNEKPWPTPRAEKALAAARAKVTEAQATLEAHRKAVKRQADIVESIEGEINARRMEAFEAELAPAKKDLLKALDNLVAAATRVDLIRYQHGADANTLGQRLFKPANAADTLADWPERTMQAAVVNAALALQTFILQRYGRVFYAS